MPSRRQEKIARVIRDAVSDIITNHLSDPRIEGLISITNVELSQDLRNANVYLSMLGKDKTSSNKTFAAIKHASGRIQMLLGERMTIRFLPRLNFRLDDKMKKTMETMKVIEELNTDVDMGSSSQKQQ